MCKIQRLASIYGTIISCTPNYSQLSDELQFIFTPPEARHTHRQHMADFVTTNIPSLPVLTLQNGQYLTVQYERSFTRCNIQTKRKVTKAAVRQRRGATEQQIILPEPTTTIFVTFRIIRKH